MFSPQGPSLREVVKQVLSSVEGGYDLLAPKFDHTPFRIPDGVLDATADALRPLGPFGQGLGVCCGTGVGVRGPHTVRHGQIVCADFSGGMLAKAQCCTNFSQRGQAAGSQLWRITARPDMVAA